MIASSVLGGMVISTVINSDVDLIIPEFQRYKVRCFMIHFGSNKSVLLCLGCQNVGSTLSNLNPLNGLEYFSVAVKFVSCGVHNLIWCC